MGKIVKNRQKPFFPPTRFVHPFHQKCIRPSLSLSTLLISISPTAKATLFSLLPTFFAKPQGGAGGSLFWGVSQEKENHRGGKEQGDPFPHP